MGSPLGSTLANAFFVMIKKNWLNECLIQFKTVVYRLYVGDILLCLNLKNI